MLEMAGLVIGLWLNGQGPLQGAVAADGKGEVNEPYPLEIQSQAVPRSIRIRLVGQADIVFLDVAMDDAVSMDFPKRGQAGAQQPKKWPCVAEGMLEGVAVAVARPDLQPIF